ncbi:MAG: primosomal protein N' [Planctomycetes bacterium]|nr:primosomal protein N' [Planctomycetota bacterium]
MTTTDRQPGTLFGEQTEQTPDTPSATAVGVAVAANVWADYDYAWPDGWPPPQPGLRVRVSFGRGNRTTAGFVVRVGRPRTTRALKHVAERVDTAPQLDAVQLELARWISDYYLTPLGLVLPAMVPSAVGRHAPKTETVVRLACQREDWPRQLGVRQRQILDELLEARKQGLDAVPLEQLRRHSQAAADTVRRLLARKLITTATRPVVLEDLSDAVQDDAFDLNDDQRAAVGAIVSRLGQGFAPLLLHGVTGSGKTEVYIRAIRAAIADGGQAILLAPEIALATQTLQRLAGRLPRVAVLHSQLTDAQRAFYYQQIRDGHASVVIGPRSAVFAPTRSLRLIIVDEEHEGSYKQDSAPRYHGRDVAIKRAHLAGVPIVLGSATPSLESLLNARRGRYTLVRLPERVRGLPMPHLNLVHLRRDLTPGKIELVGRTLTAKIAGALDRSQQIILLMNRRGYASFVFCPSCQWEMQCPDCSRAMVYHQAIQLAQCHYCQHAAALPEWCPGCSKKLLLFGMGIQRIEDELARKFPLASVARMDSDTMTTPGQFARLLEGFRTGRIDILLGTQMVAKGLDFPRVSLVGVVSADTSLTIPDFRAAERTFQLIVQVAGRAGRAERGGEVIVQTLHGDDPAIRRAVTHDYDGFADDELPLREQFDLPPYGRLVRLLVRHENATRCEEAADLLAARLREIFPPGAGVSMMGPMAAPIVRIRKQFRRHVLLMCPTAGAIQNRLAPLMDDLGRQIQAELIADVDPISLA